ncbi:MAG: hypothetical protein LBK23_09580 [Oscillospiraceae bacterium]|jgi:hypothetical protein|nr:hypothetical protein [Oscillospiraceae bacterium]
MFLPYSADVDKSLPNEEYPVSAGDFYFGMAAFLENGRLKKASGYDTPDYICVQQIIGAQDGDVINVVHIDPDTRYQAPAASLPTIGVGYDVASDGLSIAASTDVGNFVVDAAWVSLLGGEYIVVGRFGSLDKRLDDIEARLDALE